MAEELGELKALLTIGESYFFRDRPQFELIKNRIVPSLMKARGVSGMKRLKFLSAGCSGGEEPYSLAITAQELGLPERGWDVEIIGADITEEFLSRARDALFGAWSLRNADPGTVKRHFRKKGDEWELNGDVRKMVSFVRTDLAGESLPDGRRGLVDFDLILCRNVFIYYSREAVSSMVSRLLSMLREGGYLVTGHGELHAINTAGLKIEIYPESVVYVREMERESRVTADFRVQEPPLMKAVPAPPDVRKLPLTPVQRPGRISSIPKDVPAALKRGGERASLEEAKRSLKEGRYAEALGAAEKSLMKEGGSPEAHLLIGAASANMGRLELAMEHLKMAAGIAPLLPEPYYFMAQVSSEKGDAGAAKVHLNRALYLAPNYVPACLDLAEIFDMEGEGEKAAALRKMAIGAIKAMPPEETVFPYGGITAGELIARMKVGG